MRSAATCSGWSAGAQVRPGTPSTGCPTAGRSSAVSGPRGRPSVGHVIKRTAEAWLRDVLDQARAGTLPGMVRTTATVEEAWAEWLRYSAEERGWSPRTMRGRRSSVRAHFVSAFGSRAIDDLTAAHVERWRSGLPATMSTRSKNKLVIELRGVFKRARKVWGLPVPGRLRRVLRWVGAGPRREVRGSPQPTAPAMKIQ